MSATQFFVNETAHTMFVGGRMLAPGEGRDVPLMFLPATHRPEPAPLLPPAEPSLDDMLADLLGLSVKAVVVQLPELTHEALDRLEALERDALAPRKTLLEAVGAERIKRAADTFQAELDAQHAAQLAALSPEERAALSGGPADADQPSTGANQPMADAGQPAADANTQGQG